MTLDDAAFDRLATAALQTWCDAVDAAELDGMECELQDGILNIEVDAAGTFLLSKHAPTRQLWLSSPLSGASHYQFDDATARWRSTRDDADLLQVLNEELSRAAGQEIRLPDLRPLA